MPDETPRGNGADTSVDTMDPNASETADALAALSSERDQLAREKAELQDMLLRRQAEFENSRRRAERERMEFAEYAGMETVKALLPTLDDFERALQAAEASETADKEFVKGVQLTYNRLLENLKKQGLEPILTENQKFDPHLHHAVEMAPNDTVEDHTVLAEYQRGYYFKGKLLRPAMVKVAVRP